MIGTAPPPERKCKACNGTGYPPVKQPAQPGRQIYPAPCKECGGKGRIKIERPPTEAALHREQRKRYRSDAYDAKCNPRGMIGI